MHSFYVICFKIVRHRHSIKILESEITEYEVLEILYKKVAVVIKFSAQTESQVKIKAYNSEHISAIPATPYLYWIPENKNLFVVFDFKKHNVNNQK